jgi:hypothetical protein
MPMVWRRLSYQEPVDQFNAVSERNHSLIVGRWRVGDGRPREKLEAEVGTSNAAMRYRRWKPIPLLSPRDGVKGSQSPAHLDSGRGSRIGGPKESPVASRVRRRQKRLL